MARKVWGAFVFALGVLWFVAGVIRYVGTHFSGLLYVFCGIVLVRLGYNLYKGDTPH